MKRQGMTLIELLVALAILGSLTLVAAITVRDYRRLQRAPGERERLRASIEDARRRAIRSGETERVQLRLQEDVHAAVARPDGSVIADSTITRVLDLDRFAGVPRDASGGVDAHR